MNTNEIKPSVRIGKKGITEESIKEINKLLKKKKTIKIKFLKSVIGQKDKNELFEELSKKTDSKIIEKKGFTIILNKDIK